MTEPALPTYRSLLWPTLNALAEELGGSGSNHEVVDAVIERAGITDAQLAVVFPEDAKAKGPKVPHRIAFALSSLKGGGAVDNPSRGVWTINAKGRSLVLNGEEAVTAVDKAYRDELRANRKATTSESSDDASAAAEEEAAESDDSWKHLLADVLVEALTPTDFEVLVLRLMREEGCTDIRATPPSADGGIDGIGVLRSGLLTFPVCFQMKLYKPGNNVGSKEIRDLRGAVSGRGGRGIFITTSDFTRSAIEEATRNQDTPIDLINGVRLAELLYKHGLGVEDRPTVVLGFFANFSTKT